MRKVIIGLWLVGSLWLGVTPLWAAGATGGTWSKASCRGAAGSLSADVATIQGIECLIANILNAALTMFSFVGFAMFVYASFKLMIAGNSPNSFQNAKDTFVYAIFGFLLALSSFVIIQLISTFTGLNTFMTIKFLDDTVATSS